MGIGDIRVQEYGAYSHWPRTMKQAEEMVEQIMRRNGCGNIQERQSNGIWKLIGRFERRTGIIPA